MAKAARRLFIYLDNAAYEVSLERLKIRVASIPAKPECNECVETIEESAEDYVHPSRRVAAAELAVLTRRGVPQAASAYARAP
jgi:hypothetical protein